MCVDERNDIYSPEQTLYVIHISEAYFEKKHHEWYLKCENDKELLRKKAYEQIQAELLKDEDTIFCYAPLIDGKPTITIQKLVAERITLQTKQTQKHA